MKGTDADFTKFKKLIVIEQLKMHQNLNLSIN